MLESRQDRFGFNVACNVEATGGPNWAAGDPDLGPSSHMRNPPLKAFALSPSLHRGGRSLSILELPPPRTTSSGSRAATSLSTTSKTCFRHLFFPSLSSPRAPT